MLKEKLLKKLQRELSPSDKSVLKLFTIVEQKDKVVFRMPKTLFTFNALWDEITFVAESIKIPVSKVSQFATVEELDDILSNIEWLWKNNLPLGFVTMVAGEPGIGKSLFVLDIAKVITNGLCFPNSDERTKPAKVLWVDTEMKQQLLNSRSKSMGLIRSNILIPAIDGNLLAKFDAGEDEHKKHILNIIEDEEPILLVVDSLGHSHSRGENRIEEIRPVMDFLASTARDKNIAVIVVHHLNKGREQEAAEVSLTRVRGSTDIVATPVVIFAIEKSKEEENKLRQIKNNISRQPEPLSMTLEYHDEAKEELKSIRYDIYKPPPRKKYKKELCADWLRELLSQNDNGVPLLEIKSIGSGIGYTTGNIYSARDILGDEITFTGTGNRSVWHLSKVSTQDGEADNDSMKKIKRSKNGKKPK